MKFMSLFPIAILVGTVVAAQVSYDFSTRDLDEEVIPSARELRDELVLRALHHVTQQTREHADLVARTYFELDNALYPRWGSGKYVIDDNTYHRDVKPIILQEMNKIKGFSKCGKNPDFHVERDGTVYPEPTDKTAKKKGLCSKKTFSINMHDTLIRYVHH